MIEVNELSFGYKSSEPLLKRLSFTIASNTRFAILGENGSGKTSLLKILAGSQNSYVGEIKNTFSKISFIPTTLNNFLLPWYSIKENLSFFKSNGEDIDGADVSEFEGVFRNLMPKFNGNDFFSKKIYETSSGQKAVLAIICSLSNSPNLLILDETFSNLSAAQTDIVMNYLKEQQSLTIIFTSHSNRVVDSFSTDKYTISNNYDE